MYIPPPPFRKTLALHPPIIFILIFEACQRFANSGVQGILFMYLSHELSLPRNMSIGMFHAVVAVGYLSGVVCTMLTDSCVRKLRLTLVCCLTTIVADAMLIFITTWPCKHESMCQWAVYGVLFVRYCGTGGLRDTMRTLGADQFKLPSEEMHLRNYYQMFHYAMTLGTVLGYLIPPILRVHTFCNGKDYCFTLAFFVPACFMLVALASLLIGWRFLKPLPPWGSCIAGFVWVLYSAMRNRNAHMRGKRDFLDKARRDFREQFVVDVRATLRVLSLFAPLPVFWAAFEQVFARFVAQAQRMDGTFDKYGQYAIEPEHMQVIIPVVVFILMPLLDHWLVPLVRSRWHRSCGMKVRFGIGGMLVGIAMFCAGIHEYIIQSEDLPMPPARETMLIYINMHDYCDVTFRASFVRDDNKRIDVPHNSIVIRSDIKVRVPRIFNYSLQFHEPKDKSRTVPPHLSDTSPCHMFYTGTSKLRHSSLTVIVTFHSERRNNHPDGERIANWPVDDLPLHDPDECKLQLPKVGLVYSRGLIDQEQHSYRVEFLSDRRNYSHLLDPNRFGLPFKEMLPGKYRVHQENYPSSMDVYREYYRGGVYLEEIDRAGNSKGLIGSVVARPNRYRMEWQILQNTLMAVGMFLYPVLLLEYAYTQVPVRMKPMLLTVWQLSLAVANMLVSLLSYSHCFTRSVWPYFTYVGLMLFDELVLVAVLVSYKNTNKYLPRLVQVRAKRHKLGTALSTSSTAIAATEDGDRNSVEEHAERDDDEEYDSDESTSSSDSSDDELD